MGCSMKFLRGPAAFYAEATRILDASPTFWCIAKTPTALLSTQREHAWKLAFFEHFENALEHRNDLVIKYIFSLPLTQQEILASAKADSGQAHRDLDRWLRLSKDPRIELRTIPWAAPFSCIIGDAETALLLVYPNQERACLVTDNAEVPFYREYFMQLLATADPDNERIVAALRKQIG